MDYSIPPTLGNINAALASQNVTVGTLAIGGATISTYALAITGTVNVSSNIFTGGYMDATAGFNAGSSAYIGWSARGYMRASSDGVFKLGNNAETGFGRLQFGGTTNLFPALKRNGTALQARLADDSGFAYFQAASYYMGNNSFITDSSDGVIKLSNNAGTDFGLLQFGGTTAAYPAWKRSSTTLQARLADDSGSASLRASALMVDSGTNMISSSVAFNNGAAAAAGTLTNAPAAGNPTKWIPINDNGTTRYIPAW